MITANKITVLQVIIPAGEVPKYTWMNTKAK